MNMDNFTNTPLRNSHKTFFFYKENKKSKGLGILLKAQWAAFFF